MILAAIIMSKDAWPEPCQIFSIVGENMIVGIDMKFYEFVEFEMNDNVEVDSTEFWDIVYAFMEKEFPHPEEYIISIKQDNGQYSIV